MSQRWRGSVCGSVQHPRVKTDEGKDKRLFPAQLYPSNDTGNAFRYNFFPPSLTHSPLLSSVLPPLSCVSKPFRLSLDHALTSHADGKVILLTCATSLHLLLHLYLSLWLFGIVSQLSTKQTSFPLFLYNPLSASWAWLRPGFVQKTQQPQLPSLTISLSLTPHVRLAGVGALVCSFQIIGNTQPTRPYAITTHLNPMRLL